MKRQKVFIIGLDAADPTLLEYWIEQGELPFFGQLMREGTYTRLECIPPVFSPVEWTSIMTGKNPGKHGIFGFEKLVDGGHRVKVISREDREGPTFYEILGEAGKHIGVINMTTTYPAAELNGFMIAGMETPDVNSPGASYPPNLIKDLQTAGHNYQINPGVSGLILDGKTEEAVKALNDAADARYRATKHLLKAYDPDLLVVLFSQIDNGSHYFWKYHDELYPGCTDAEKQQFGEVLLGLYQRHEDILKSLMDEYPDATFIICSDHGMGFNYEARYYLKELFTRLGWYCPANGGSTQVGLNDLFLQAMKTAYWFTFRRLPMRYKRKLAGLFPDLRGRVEAALSDVDWDKTRLYSKDSFVSLVINRTNEHGESAFASEEAYLDFRETIMETLYALRETGTGKPLVKKVHTRESLYDGDFVEKGPDLVIEWDEVRLTQGVQCGEITITPTEIQKNALQRILSGEHRPHGILLMKGEAIEENRRLEDCSILDIAPTVLYTFGMPIPRAMDGRVLSEAFCESFLAEHPIKYVGDADPKDVDEHGEHGDAYSFDESLAIRQRLKSLGYID